MKRLFSLLSVCALLLCAGCVPVDQEAASSQDPVDAQNILYTEEEATLPNGKTEIGQIGGKLDIDGKTGLSGSENKGVDHGLELPDIETGPGSGYIPNPEPVEPTTETK